MKADKDLRRLKRKDLIEIIYQQKKVEEELREQILDLEKRLEERNLQIANAGSIADAAMQLSGIFEAAQMAADMYVASVTGASVEDKVNLAKAPIRGIE